jgi:hypothetical protein
MSERKKSTLAALLEGKPKRGRPPRAVSRRNIYVELTKEQKKQTAQIARMSSDGLKRADIPDLAVNLLNIRLALLRREVADRDREIPEGVTDLDSLYLLWDLPLPSSTDESNWTSIRLSPQESIELGRLHGVLKAIFGVNRSQVYWLCLALFWEFFNARLEGKRVGSLPETIDWMESIYL